ncbi:MAG: YHS domain-containing protein [Nitrososphaerales archaeon]
MFWKRKAKDPVCGMSLEIKKAEFKSEYNESMYYFCSAECKNVFEKDPVKYLEMRHKESSHHHSGGHCC